jgi:Trypsin
MNFLIFTSFKSSHSGNNQQLKVRLGEWDAASNSEPISAQEFFVSNIFIHPQFSATNLKNNIAILRLSSSIQLGQVPTISTACLPSGPLPSGSKCWVGGWGRVSNSATLMLLIKL